ncbi:helix-turn-helix transcriptional regulator [Polynucleobacter paneuropaeus]|nr:helix-turn-helix transcriptional regulator [Polynucleobacter paneuropaeus]MBT8604903.1 helix-turn-helix transcriptional regulator [Polynucleobacter paneuropaeus]
MWEKELHKQRTILARNIKNIRKERGLAQEALALEAGVDRTLVSKIERLIANPSLEILVKLSLALEVPVIRLLQPKHL